MCGIIELFFKMYPSMQVQMVKIIPGEQLVKKLPWSQMENVWPKVVVADTTRNSWI